ncbi:MAG: rhodanese-like domain-containing protein [Planctomycetota bacterium]
MFFKQYYLGCLAHASYLIGDAGEAAVVDPQRDVDAYLADCEANGLMLRWIIETHVHADFVSGHAELAERSGATIALGRQARPGFGFHALADGDEIIMGNAVIRAIETPGHTPEHISLLVTDASAPDAPPKVLTGDTLFIGDVGRPDLVASRGHTADEMAALLYDSLHHKLLALDDTVEVWPGHGKGSLCGRYMSDATSSTIGEQRRTNFMLQPMSKDEFIRKAAADQPEVPDYFIHDVQLNLAGAPPLGAMKTPIALDPAGFAAMMDDGALVLDTRDAWDFGEAHIPGSLNVGLDGRFASWVGSLVSPDQPVLLVCTGEGKMREATMRLARVGLHNAAGWLAGGLQAWADAKRELASVPQMLADELHEKVTSGGLQLLDVRRVPEYEAGHIAGATNIPLDALPDAGNCGLDPDQPVVVICSSGHRSSIASSLLERQGFCDIANLVGGTEAWEAFDFELVTPAASR